MDLPEPDPIAADNRRTRRRTLIPEEAACVLCGLSDPECLEDDHVLGWRGADNVRVWLCRNCHAQQTAARHDHQAGSSAGPHTEPISVLECIARALRSLGVFVHELAHTLFDYAEQLLELDRWLDVSAPGWRAQQRFA